MFPGLKDNGEEGFGCSSGPGTLGRGAMLEEETWGLSIGGAGDHHLLSWSGSERMTPGKNPQAASLVAKEL